MTQDHPAVETVVVDDGSSDGTAGYLSREFPQIRVVVQKNAERGAARNRGASVAKGAYLSFLDADDVLEPWHVTQLVAARQRNVKAVPDEQTVYSAPARMWDPGSGKLTNTRVSGWMKRYALSEAALLGTVLPLQGLFVPARLFASIGGFPADRAIARSEDWVFLVRLLQSSGVFRLNRPSVRIREHPGRSMTETDSVINSRRAAVALLLGESVHLASDPRACALLDAGAYRLSGAMLYQAGRVREARAELRSATRALGWLEGWRLSGRLWLQTWLGVRASRIVRALRDALRKV